MLLCLGPQRSISMKNSFFMTIEGPDGAGKTTLLNLMLPDLKNKLGADNVVSIREPGGVRISEKIRDLVLGIEYPEMSERTEALLFAAARAQLLNQVILPELKKNKLVISDRFVDSSIAYQGGGRDLGMKEVADINNFATDGLTPKLTLYVDVPSEIGIERIMKNRTDEVNRLDNDALNFHKKVRESYLQLAKENPERIFILDGTKKPEDLANESLELIYSRLPKE